MEKNNKNDISIVDSTELRDIAASAKKEKKPKRYKKGILYNGDIYIPAKRSKEFPRVKNLLCLGSSFYIECARYLLDGKYFNTDKDTIAYLLKKRIYVEYPTDTALTGLHGMYKGIGILDDAEKALEKVIQGKLASPWTSTGISELVKLKRDRMVYEEAMKRGNPKCDTALLNRIKYLLSMCRCIIAHRKSFQVSDMEKISAYHGAFADFAECLPTKLPQIAITRYNAQILSLSESLINGDCYGLLFRLYGIGNSLPILLTEKDIRKINSIENYSQLLEKIQIGKIGKIVGIDAYISPYEYAMIFVNPLKDIESVVNTI